MIRQIVDPLSRVILAAIIMTVGCQVSGATIGAKSASLGDVESAIGSAHEGDTVIIPAGTASWTSSLVITKGITLIGQTTTDSVAGTANDLTIIKDNLPRPPSQPIIRLTTTLGKSYRITGITLAPGTVTATNSNGAVIASGNSQSVRIDHCHFSSMPAQGVYLEIYGKIFGVADHNVLQLSGSSESFVFTADAWPYPGGSPTPNFG